LAAIRHHEPEADAVVAEGIDRAYLVETLSKLARVPTGPSPGFDTLMDPDDPKLVRYVQDVMRPEITRLGHYDIIDAALNNIVVRLGTGESDKTLLIQNYTPTLHFTMMHDPLSGKVGNAARYGYDEPAVFGQGVSTNKCHQAAMLAVLKMLSASGVELRGRLYWAVNNEGRSSHACSEAVLASLDRQPSFSILQMPTGLEISLGQRGRVDVDVHVKGKAAHSSSPDQGLSAIDGAYLVMERIRRMSWPDDHPLLGSRQRPIVYKIKYEPVAPHTLPSDAYLTIDRRMLPGDSPDAATAEIRNVIGDLSPYEVTVERGVYMLPALVDPEHDGVRNLHEAHAATTGNVANTFYRWGTFDAGGLCSLGVPAVLYGAGGESAGMGSEGARGSLLWPEGEDFVTISSMETEARVLARLILTQLA
jgi:acetylornithine deacetylase/succinyl-diaminopimelate desuccinylase-like protein